jgi:glutathione synthase/RimK-type ligase-like ATP-grasp enzyme
LTLTVGILTLYVGPRRQIEERKFLAACTVEGAKIGVRVVVFTPDDVESHGRHVRAHEYLTTQRRWQRTTLSLPRIIYDRCRYQKTARFAAFKRFRRTHSGLTFLNEPLANKWRVHEALRTVPDLTSYIPETRLLRTPKDVQTMLRQFQEIYVKPANGTGGRGIMRVRCTANGACVAEGRNSERGLLRARRKPLTDLANWVVHSYRTQKTLLQQAIDIRLRSGAVHDYRLVVQKDANGKWSFTGGGARIGGRGSVTSNLHGGGRALKWRDLLRNQFGARRTQNIMKEMTTLSLRVAQQLEKQYGRLCELGLDIAVDRSGHPWLLEVNPKPAREIFSKTGQNDTYRKAVRKPLEYARWLSQQT